ncbi:expansin-like protein [Cavenderia fasciculata]|uniref:Expansin-like protein n=1 Tax=Cavenderia fasciculata TaxID=261658 RepID=F4PWR6_CACFS|nr:expansin-like protein [Cavenderia fasciculata]EGG20430.1 expansin-like protein [Cavenderia fasciculata]|eukprot:XP_004367413.1 expansin-like protein [Cavenderia fasciculata]
MYKLSVLLLFVLTIISAGVFAQTCPYDQTPRLASATHYSSYTLGGGCSFGTPWSSTGPHTAYIAALSEVWYNNGTHCGNCLEVSNGNKSVTVIIQDMCPIEGNPICKNDYHLDLSPEAFAVLGNVNDGVLYNLTWREVTCDNIYPETVQVQITKGSSLTWASLLVFGYKIGIKQVQIQLANSTTFTSTTRYSYNNFIGISQQELFKYPFTVKIISDLGESIEVTIPELEVEKIYDTKQQFGTGDCIGSDLILSVNHASSSLPIISIFSLLLLSIFTILIL